MRSWLRSRSVEILSVVAFLGLLILSLCMPLVDPTYSEPAYSGALNAALSVATGGLTSFLFYYLVNDRNDARRRQLVLKGVANSYNTAKRNIVVAVIQASRKGRRTDLVASSTMIDRALTVVGFREMFEGGTEGDEGFYAFQNQMSYPTEEFEEILFNFRQIARAADRLTDGSGTSKERSYQFFIGIGTVIARAERNGAGYDESKLLCGLIWEMFAGWNMIEGDVGHDPFEAAMREAQHQ